MLWVWETANGPSHSVTEKWLVSLIQGWAYPTAGWRGWAFGLGRLAGSASATSALAPSPSLAHLRKWVLPRSPGKACPVRGTSSPVAHHLPAAPPKHDGEEATSEAGSPVPPEEAGLDTQHK